MVDPKPAHHRPPKTSIYRRPNSPYYWVSWYWNGKQVRQSTGKTNEREAKKFADLLGTKLWNEYYGTAKPRRSNPTLDEVFKCYRRRLVAPRVSEFHAETQQGRLDRLMDALGGADIMAGSVDTAKVDEYISSRYEQGVKPTTIRNDITALRAAFRQAVDEGLLLSMPFKVRAPKPDKKDKVIPLKDMKRILKGCDPAKPVDRLIFLAAFTGLRRGDLLSLRWEHLDLKTGWLEVVTHKANRPVKIYMVPELVRFLKPSKALPKAPVVGLAVASGQNVFRRTKRLLYGPREGDRYSPEEYGYGLHTFRHTLSSELAATGASTAYIAHIMGHGSKDVTSAHYIHPTDEKLRAVMEAIRYRIKHTASTLRAEVQ